MYNIKTLLLVSITLLFVSSSLPASSYSFRKYGHVKKFYSEIYEDSISVGLKYKIPPATIMAIAGLESGYGSGYVAQITGNILSLGAFKDDYELPSLYLPYSKSKKRVLFDPKEIKDSSKKDLFYKQRPKSLKRDYRPDKYAGTTNRLELLIHDKKLKTKACKSCLVDFSTRWISYESKVKSFKSAKSFLDKQVKLNGINILFKKELNEKFIDMIGGHAHSFNYRKTWPKKVKLIMNKVGLVELLNDIYLNHKNFNEAWGNK